MRWNEAGSWIWSDTIAHEPLISAEDFEAAQAIMAAAGRARRSSREAHQRVTHPYVLRGRLYCGYCGRRMQGQYSNRGPTTAAATPGNTPWPATSATPATSTSARPTCCPPSTAGWSAIFAPHRLEQTIREMQAAQEPATARPGSARAGDPGRHRRLRRPARPLPGRPRRRSRPPGRRRMDPPGQSRARRRARPRRQPARSASLRQAHRRRHPRPHHRPGRPARRHPRRRARRQGSHLRADRAQGHLPARTRQNPGRRDDQPGDIRQEDAQYGAMGRVRGGT